MKVHICVLHYQLASISSLLFSLTKEDGFSTRLLSRMWSHLFFFCPIQFLQRSVPNVILIQTATEDYATTHFCSRSEIH